MQKELYQYLPGPPAVQKKSGLPGSWTYQGMYFVSPAVHIETLSRFNKMIGTISPEEHFHYQLSLTNNNTLAADCSARGSRFVIWRRWDGYGEECCTRILFLF